MHVRTPESVHRGPNDSSALSDEPRLYFDNAQIHETATRRSPGPIAWLALRYAVEAARLRVVEKVHFRQRQNDRACSAYSAMSPASFSLINARQAWANWRTIPRNLNGRLPARPITAIDLCCGIGDSTAVLAWYCAPGSRIVGLEVNPAFVDAANERKFTHADGSPADVCFVARSVLDGFHGHDRRRLAPASVDLINASGAIGCHFDCEATQTIAAECVRVLRPGGLALLDVGAEGTSRCELLEIFDSLGFTLVGQARSCALDKFEQLCLTKSLSPGTKGTTDGCTCAASDSC